MRGIPVLCVLRVVLALCNVCFQTEDRLDSFRLACAIKFDHAVHHAVVGDGNRFLPEFLCAFHKFRNARRAVQKAVLGMYVQVYKRLHGSSECL